jgi:hypothetical protein
MQGRFDDAASEFELGFRFQPQPLFLYNIAQSSRRAGRIDKALDYYQRYLAASPQAPERAEVEQQLAELSRRRAELTAPAPPASPAPTAPPAAHARRRLYIGVGVGVGAAALVIAGVATGLALGLSRGAPSSELGNHVFMGQ